LTHGLRILLTSTPLSIKKHLNPFTPDCARAFKDDYNSAVFRSSYSGKIIKGLAWLLGTMPPQKATSVQHCACAAARFVWKCDGVVVGGIEFRGISTRVVTPPDAAALVPVQKPSQLVRPGSFRWTWALQNLWGLPQFRNTIRPTQRGLEEYSYFQRQSTSRLDR
jgi:hypothetical protein